MKKLPLFLIVVCMISSFLACQRDDDEPSASSRAISRLYVSTSDYDGSSGSNNFYNVFVIDPADSSNFAPERATSIYQFTSSARGGRFIHYSPFSGGLVFQGSKNDPVYIDTAVQIISVSNTGVLKNTGRLGNRDFNDVKGLAYTVVNSGNFSESYLLMLNADTLAVVDRPVSKGSSRLVKPRYHMPLDYSPWGINITDRDVFVSSFSKVSTPNSFNGIVVYKDLTSKFLNNSPDSLLTGYNRFNLTISDAKNIRGISYSKSKDLLVVTDFEGEGIASKGRILFFEEFSKHTATATLVPSRIVNSSALKQPTDIAIDTRADGKYIYIADPIARRVFRFLIADQGDVTPNGEINLLGRSPVSVSLDARAAGGFF